MRIVRPVVGPFVRDGVMVIVAALGVVLPSGPTAAATERFATVTTAATLTVLSGQVEHARAGGGPLSRAASGADLAEGDRVVTGADGRALITFLDGSTVTVEPGSDVTVKQADAGSRERSRVRVLITAGTVWARVAGWLGGRATVTLESNAYAATAHDGLIGGQTRQDGTFVCWTRAGALSLADREGRPQAGLSPGQKATISPGQRAVTEPFAVNQSTLEVTALGPVLPLIVMPDGARVAGFVDPGVEVNQVFGSLTAVRDGTRVIEVPAGAAGPYLLVLAALDDGPYEVRVAGRFQASPAYRQERSGRVKRGDRLGGEITQSLAPSASSNARTAQVTDGRLAPLQELNSPRRTGTGENIGG